MTKLSKIGIKEQAAALSVGINRKQKIYKIFKLASNYNQNTACCCYVVCAVKMHILFCSHSFQFTIASFLTSNNDRKKASKTIMHEK